MDLRGRSWRELYLLRRLGKKNGDKKAGKTRLFHEYGSIKRT
ncbi:hypothetical protein GJA_3596 [Janthinobacterium agaricidamnosum NBRC 102515 = DSM 9628]|uniref:Uncharacterized protein n=1 Tax=Janthinobacterium agaricidamnosum NBRC 102515 = DSM 9628 TaxID=1349767 RepID=W0V8K0_9BURK|nr:hypothetical protein GJA_3596 [Janthinobacterium agaricidamnosum NBRC 102515 = DSM 9628]